MTFSFLLTFKTRTLIPFLFNNIFYSNYWFNNKNFTKNNQNNYYFFKYNDLIKFLFLVLSWLKVRVLYFINNWVYTTNHKRIAVNYFWFVILAGIVGMVLATVIRLELAYPGVGIFAGDSLQYLSLVTAHGVIMVFFMIMPLLFGAFANFLLPTQLGVHDVAFPRLNSAAFWFLPAGLIMLAQLVCVDRRYQRMNCFNIREIQSILKRRFFTDLINTTDHHFLLNETVMGLRFKTNNINSLNPNMFIVYNYGLDISHKNRLVSFNILNTQDYFLFISNSFFFNNINYFASNFYLNFFSNFYLYFSSNFFSFNNTFFFFNKLVTTFYLFFLNFSGFFLNFNFFWNFNLKDLLSYFSLSGWHDWFDINYFNNFFLNLSNRLLIKFVKLTTIFFDFVISNDLASYYIFYQAPLSYIYILCAWIRIFLTNNFSNYFKLLISKLNLDGFFSFMPYLEFLFLHKFIPISKNDSLSSPFSSIELYSFKEPYFFTRLYLDVEMYLFGDFFDIVDSSGIGGAFYSYADYVKNDFFYFDEFFPKNFFNYIDYYSSNLYSQNNLFSLSSNNETFLDKTFFKTSSVDFFVSPLNSYSKIDYNSYFVYFYLLTNYFLSLPYYLYNFVINFFFLFNISYLVANFNDLFMTWYLPLLIGDNIFFTLWSKFSNLMLIENNFQSIFFFNNLGTNLNASFIDPYELGFTSHYDLKLGINYFISIFYDFKFIFVNCVSFLCDLFASFLNIISIILFDYKTNSFFNFFYDFNFKTSIIAMQNNTLILNFFSLYFSPVDSKTQFLLGNEEINSSSVRYHKFDNPIFKYDYKSGDYFPKLYREVYTFLFSTLIDLTGSLRQAPWFFSVSYLEFFNNTLNKFTQNINQNSLNLHAWNATRFDSVDAFYSFFFTLNNENLFLNKRWLSLNSLNQKFYRMFNTSSMQQRIYSNWRQLKFTREAWRCKLLSARHQKTLYRRYVNEDGVFWSIERNAKDLLPGWAMITPFSSRTRFTAVGKTDIGLMGVLLVLNSSIISGANFLVTYRYLSTLNNRKMRDARAFFTEGIMVSSWMMIFANPMLVIGIIMLLSDRHWQTSFFDYSGGGDTVLFQHMFWFFGHPEVYIIILPTFGFTNTILSYYLKKRISARASLMYSMYTIAFLGFFVWGHHMYMVGLSHTTRMLFSTLTVMISVPAATKLMHWCVTLVNSALTIELPMLCILTFIFFFISGGISGMCVANTGMDILFHDTFYVVGHFHVMLSGAAMIGCFGGFYFYFVAIFGVKYSRIYAYLHFVYYLLGQMFTVIPMIWLGYAGMPRRVLDYPAAMGGWHSVISGGHMLSVAGMFAFFIMIFDSLRQSKAVVRNSFGVGRYNTRLNFYIYEIARLIYVQQKSWSLFKFNNPSSLKLNGLNYTNFEHLETTLFSYVFYKKNI